MASSLGEEFAALDFIAHEAVHAQRLVQKEKEYCLNLKNVISSLDADYQTTQKEKAEFVYKLETLKIEEVTWKNILNSSNKSIETAQQLKEEKQKQLEEVKRETVEKQKHYDSTVEKYAKMWESYKKIYERFPLAEQLRKEGSELEKMQNHIVQQKQLCAELQTRLKQKIQEREQKCIALTVKFAAAAVQMRKLEESQSQQKQLLMNLKKKVTSLQNRKLQLQNQCGKKGIRTSNVKWPSNIDELSNAPSKSALQTPSATEEPFEVCTTIHEISNKRQADTYVTPPPKRLTVHIPSRALQFHSLLSKGSTKVPELALSSVAYSPPSPVHSRSPSQEETVPFLETPCAASTNEKPVENVVCSPQYSEDLAINESREYVEDKTTEATGGNQNSVEDTGFIAEHNEPVVCRPLVMTPEESSSDDERGSVILRPTFVSPDFQYGLREDLRLQNQVHEDDGDRPTSPYFLKSYLKVLGPSGESSNTETAAVETSEGQGVSFHVNEEDSMEGEQPEEEEGEAGGLNESFGFEMYRSEDDPASNEQVQDGMEQEEQTDSSPPEREQDVPYTYHGMDYDDRSSFENEPTKAAASKVGFPDPSPSSGPFQITEAGARSSDFESGSFNFGSAFSDQFNARGEEPQSVASLFGYGDSQSSADGNRQESEGFSFNFGSTSTTGSIFKMF